MEDPESSAPLEDPAPENALLIYDGTAFTVDIVVPVNSPLTGVVRREAYRLALELQAAASSELLPTIKEDDLPGGEGTSGAGTEILIGRTNRPVSSALWEAVNDAFCYTVQVDRQYACLVGSTDAETQKASAYFTDVFLPGHLIRQGSRLYLAQGSHRSEAAESTFVSYAVLANAANRAFSYQTEPVLTIDPIGTHNIVQGACMDNTGRYTYFILRDANDRCSMVKYDMETGTMVASKADIGCDHGNDMCYNRNNQTVLVSHCTNQPMLISVFDAETLELKERVNIGYSCSAIAYHPERNLYVVMGGGAFRLLDEHFDLVKTIPTRSSLYTSQGIHCDDNYIYRVESANQANGAEGNILEIYDWDGNYILKLELPDIDMEAETIFHLGKDLYVTCYPGKKKGGMLFRLSIA